MKTWVTQLRKGLVELLLLNVLDLGESYGYEIVQRLRAVEELAITESTVYPVLSRLRSEGYLQVRQVASSDGPPRRYVSLTRLGRARLAEMNAYWCSLTETVGELIGAPGGHGSKSWKSSRTSGGKSKDTLTLWRRSSGA